MKRDTAAIEIDGAEELDAVNTAKTAYRIARQSEAKTFDPVYDELHREVIDLQSKGIGQSWPIPIDATFLKTSAAQNLKARNSVEALEDQNERIRNLQKQVEELTLIKKVEELKKTVNPGGDKESASPTSEIEPPMPSPGN
jgi:DNA repair exonuclease SbcCD ATPase subunit